MNNTLVSLKGVSRGQRGLHKVSESKKMANLHHVFPPNFYLPGSTRKPTAERHVTLKKKDKNLHAISKEQRSTHILLVTNLNFKLSAAIVDIIINFIAI